MNIQFVLHMAVLQKKANDVTEGSYMTSF